jgi:hypothetical protein
LAVVAAAFCDAQAKATPCLATPTCTLDGQTFTLTGGSSGNGLTFIATFTTPNQNPSSVSTLVHDFLALEGFNTTYLGRAGDSSTFVLGDSVSATPSGGLTGNWTLSPGTTGDVGAFVAIHAGDGQAATELFRIDSLGLSGTWATLNGHGLSNFDLFGTPATTTHASVPEPASIAIFGTALVGFGLIRRRRRSV